MRNGFGVMRQRADKNVIQEASPDMGTTVLVRDARGLVTQKTDGRAVVTNMTYDNAGRMLTRTFPAATAENVTYTYDAFGSGATGNKGRGRLTGVTDQSGSTAIVYWRARHGDERDAHGVGAGLHGGLPVQFQQSGDAHHLPVGAAGQLHAQRGEH